jgi:hypothetical protein
MARTPASLGEGARITDFISLGVVTNTFPAKAIQAALKETGRSSVRERDMPAHVVMYYVIAQALFMQVSQREVLRCLLEGVRWLFGPKVAVKVTGKSGISQARTRLGWEPVKQLHDDVVGPDRRENHTGRLVSEVEGGQPGREHDGRRGYQGEPGRLWAAWRQPRQ